MEEIFGRVTLSDAQQRAAGAATALEVAGSRAHQRRCEAHGFAAIYAGHPRWSDKTLDEEASQRDFGATLIEAFLTRGAAVLESLRGDFSIAVVSADASRGLLAVDRMGICGLYYYSAATTLRFATRLHQVFADGVLSPRIDPQGLFDYVYFHVIPSPRTIYRDIKKLEPAQCLTWDETELRIETYWHPTFAVGLKSGTTPADLEHEVHHCIESAVRRCDTTAQTGAFLSGGLDSSTVSGMLRRVRDSAVPTFSIGFQEEGYDELPFARIAAKHFGTEAFEHYISLADIERTVPLLARFFDEPFGNSSAVPAYICANFARQKGIDILLAGDGGDELFAGNSRYAKQMVFESYGRAPRWMRKQILERWLLNGGRSYQFFPLRKLQRYVAQATIPLPDRMETHNILNNVALEDIFNADLLAQVDTAEPLKGLQRRYHAISAESAVDRMLFLDWKITLADNDIRKVSGACAIADIEVKYPMLDDSLVELSTGIPAGMKLKRNRLRAFYKDAMKNFLPSEIIDKPKHGFGLPFGQWLKASPQLSEMVEDSLADLQKRDLFNAGFIERVRKSHRDEHAAYFGTTLWVLFMLEQWWQHHPASA